jgi:hypothetical protein
MHTWLWTKFVGTGATKRIEFPRYNDAMRVLFAALFTLALPLLAGCRPTVENGGNLQIPPSGKVRIIVGKGKQTPDKVQWHWSVLGDRNWREPTADGTDLSLTGTYPLNSVSERGGCNTYMLDLVVTRPKNTTSGPVTWTATLHGSNGQTATATGTTSPQGTSDKSVRVQLDRDTVFGVPATVTLATIDDKPIRLLISK